MFDFSRWFNSHFGNSHKLHSAKAKEKFADSLMSIANALHSAAFLSVLIIPLQTLLGIGTAQKAAAYGHGVPSSCFG